MAKASFLSRLFFRWPYPLLKLGMERPLQEGDLYHVLEKDSSLYNLHYFQRLWDAERQRRPDAPNLHRAIVIDFFRSLWYIQPVMCAQYAARVIQAIALGQLIESFEGSNDNGFLWASVIVLCGVVVLFEHHHVFFFAWRKGMQLRISVVATIYEKALRLSSTHQDTSASYGRIMNLASNDVERFLLAALFVSHLVWAPLQAIAILVVGWTIMGPAFAAGFAFLVVFVPLQFWLSQRFAVLRSKIASITDRRVNFIGQAVRGVRVMKMSAYEWRFLSRIQDVRKEETVQIARANRLKALNEALFFSTNVVVALAVFLVHVVILDGTLTPGDVFTVFTLINILQLEMTKHVSLGVMGCSECYVSITRIQKFLEYPELPQRQEVNGLSVLNGPPMEENGEESNVVLSLSGVTSYWNEVRHIRTTLPPPKSTPAPSSASLSSSSSRGETSADGRTNTSYFLALDDVSVDFRRGEMTAVIGTVGSGKSALLQAIVQELPVSSGEVIRQYSTLAYASQDPWIMDGTVKDNIMMGLPLDEEWYSQVVRACGLVLDFEQLRDGDQTVVGDRGVQCSGGQRARIGLARAIYRDADVFVADDPLSAVDAKVGRQIFQEALLGLAIGRGKCVILATHQHQYLSECRCILVEQARIGCIGSYDECVAASKGNLTAHAADDTVDGLVADPASAKTGIDETTEAEGDDAVAKEELEIGDDDNKEMNVQGLVRLDTFLNYLRAMGGVWTGFFLFALFSVTQTSALLAIATFGRWAERDPSQQQEWDIIGLAIGLTGSTVILALIRAIASLQLTIKASQRLHDRMAKAVLRAKIEFFDTNPLGRILNRFSADVGSNDDLLPPTLFDFFMIAFIVLGAVFTTVATLPITLIAIPPLMWYFLSVRKTFVTSTRELKRLEGLARSPIFAMIGEALGGVATIRANNSLDFFRRKFRQAHDAHSRAFFSFIAASRWVGFRMDAIMFLFLAVVSYLSVWFHQTGWFDVDPAIFGLSLSMLLQLAGMFQWCIRQSAEVVNQMVSVERVLAFRKLEPEAPLDLDSDRAVRERGWPQHGEIVVQDLTVRYRPSLPPALEHVSFKIPAGSRVGIVGRTGSGKSTIVQTFFRLLEAEHGRIVIDGVNISQLGLHALRTQIGVIPQVPTLFSGCSVRENLDLFGLHSDEAIRKVLECCRLSHVIDDLPDGTNSIVSEGGSNFSVGQRQLLCLARAILSRSKILVLDEATASVDRRTDQLLQAALQESFSDGTIVAVAHRLDTIIEHDLILVLGSGRVLEYGSPAELIHTGGAFASMVADTGDAMSSELRHRALHKQTMKQE